jgi:endonuclease YncB( thermonuclease family)
LIRLFTVAMAGLLGTLSVPATAADPAAIEAEGVARVVRVIDGETLALADGRILRLAGILVPVPGTPAGQRFSDAARQALTLLVIERQVVLAFGPRQTDRHGRLIAQLWRAAANGSKELWIQEELLADGFARVATTPDNLLLAAEMLRVEDRARRARRGLWGDPAYRVRTPEDVGEVPNAFQVVEGRVLAVAVRRGTGYLNFGTDYRTDFTLSLTREALRLMRQAGFDPATLQGIRVRARGWLRSFNGPLIEITHPEQIEVLE